MSITTNFETFCNKLLVSKTECLTINVRCLAICNRLNKDFWNMDSTLRGRYVGSFGRNTAISNFSDIDMLFEMPSSIYNTYNAYISNGQSALLQAVKNSIAKTYPNTILKSDGQVVQVTFSNSMKFEILPAFKNKDGSYTFANSNNGGFWKKTNPDPEITAVSNGDVWTNNNLRPLCRMARAWKDSNVVQIPGLLIDTLAHRFLTTWPYRDKSYLYYDYMSRDFFSFLKNQDANQNTWYAIGSGQKIDTFGNFRNKATVAYNKSLEAIEKETDILTWTANKKWREIYGNRFPL